MKYLIVLIFSLITASVMAQGPGGLPAPNPEIPVDGGITAFLVAAGFAGAGLLGWRKRQKN